MDTWWKKIVYSRWLKGISIAGILGTVVVLFISFIGICTTSSSRNYFESYQFENDLITKAGYLRDWIVRYDENTIFTEVTPEEIADYKQKSGGTLSDEAARAGIITDRKGYYALIQNELVTDNVNLDYLAVDSQTDRTITNMKITDTQSIIKELTSRSNYIEGNGYSILNFKFWKYNEAKGSSALLHEKYYSGDAFDTQNNYHIYVALKETLEPGDKFYDSFQNFEVNTAGRKQLISISLAAGTIGLICFIYYILVVGRSKRKGEIKLNAFDHMPLEIQVILSLLGAVLCIRAIDQYGYNADISSMITFTSTGTQYQVMEIVVVGFIFLITVSFELLCLSSWVKHFKNKTMLDHVGSYSLMKKFYYSKGSKRKLFIVVGLIVSINIMIEILMIVTTDFIWSNFYLIIRPILWSLFLGSILLKLLLDYKKILDGAKEITQGNLDKKIELNRTVPMLQELATTINSMGTGLERAVGESVKSERLKTELITNVSHDLKTPLTSIISYIDLLKGETIENETAKEYIEVLDERSHRLKQLVEDLVEASKAVTGNLNAELNVLSLDELVGQAIGEYTDRLKESNLTIVMNHVEETWVLADGRHMWRIIENLLSNVCKYAMPGTRVYVEVGHNEQFGFCTVKNISREPLNIEASELTERFVRGDSSRTTEGSGLGLAIAQSLANLQQGNLGISIDGDLFKTDIKVPLAEKESISLAKDE